jgi:cation transport regulator ChaB
MGAFLSRRTNRRDDDYHGRLAVMKSWASIRLQAARDRTDQVFKRFLPSP